LSAHWGTAGAYSSGISVQLQPDGSARLQVGVYDGAIHGWYHRSFEGQCEVSDDGLVVVHNTEASVSTVLENGPLSGRLCTWVPIVNAGVQIGSYSVLMERTLLCRVETDQDQWLSLRILSGFDGNVPYGFAPPPGAQLVMRATTPPWGTD